MMIASRIGLVGLVVTSACASYQTIGPGHKGVYFDPDPSIGTRREVLGEGRHKLGHMCWFPGHICGRIYDFDVTLASVREEIRVTSKENLAIDAILSVQYKPIDTELYLLATEVGTADYYNEAVRNEFRSAASRVFARHFYTELGVDREKIENEIESDVRRRIQGRHVNLLSVTMETRYAPELLAADQAKLISERENVRVRAAMEQEAARQKAQAENDDLKQKLAQQRESERAQEQIKNKEAEQKLELERQMQTQQLDLARQLEEKKNERMIAEEDAKAEKAKAAATVAKAKAEAEARIIIARAVAEENRAKTAAISPLTVQMRAYEALGQLGGTNTTIVLGDFSKMPQFLFPPGFTNGLLPYGGGRPTSTLSKQP